MRLRASLTTAFSVVLVGALLSTSPALATDFTRGDCNADGNILGGTLCDVADVVFSLSYLFRGGPSPTCEEACNTNDDSSFDIADAVFQLAFCFLGGDPPPPPLSECAADPTPSLSCREFAPCGSPDPCQAQLAQGVGPCALFFGYRWNGTACEGVSGCSCEGPDCERLFDSIETCERVHSDCPGRCAPQDIQGVGPCDAVLGSMWDGRHCIEISGCDCEGEDCEDIYQDFGECVRDHAECPPICEPMDVHPVGVCRVILGWHFDGESCVPLSACNCLGEDCDGLFRDAEECERIHADCQVDCQPQHIIPRGECAVVLGVFWDGRECRALSACECEGADCEDLFDSIDECIDDHEPCRDICAPWRVEGEGPCDAVLGWYWDGFQCRELSGCDCVGEDCHKLMSGPGECYIQVAQHCPPPCSPMQVRAEGDCEAILGVYWDGGQCRTLVGCDCVGVDCSRLTTLEICRTSHVRCPDPCVAMDVREVGLCEPIHGWFFDGQDCRVVSGCECAGEDCDNLFVTLRECLDVNAACPVAEEPR